MPFRMGPWEIALIVVIILIIFGVGKLPQVGGAIGKGIRSFRKAQSGELDDEEEDEEEEEEEEKPKPKKRATAKKKTTAKKTVKK
jgi:sec-independent protein translocase protein TatA